MNWIKDFQLFMFDFDGLLVNTENLHFEAYRAMCAARGVDFTWDFPKYCSYAHYEAEGFREALFKDFPALKASEPDWDILYAEKKTALMELVHQGKIDLMPGVETLLKELEKHRIKRCVVTHSPKALIDAIKDQHKILHTIPHWITREHYSNPKPDPECYLTAISKFSNPGDKIIGFEDTPRGLKALMGTCAKPIIVCQVNYPELPDFIRKGATHLRSLDEWVKP